MVDGKRELALVLVLACFVLASRGEELTVRFSDPPPSGSIVFELFDSSNTFGDLRDPVKRVVVAADGRESYRIDNVSAGEYALMLYLDENGNGILDRNFIGIPSEPTAYSNGYRPKGPPSYERARFSLAAQTDSPVFDAELYRALGRRGRIGVGIGVLARSSPYRDYDGAVWQMLPAITYVGKRLQIMGPMLQVGVVGGGTRRLALTAAYRMGVYDEDDSDVLAGLGDRKDTLMVGPALQVELPGGVDFSLAYNHDVLDRIGGGAAAVRLGKSFQWGILRMSPRVGLNWVSSDLTNHDFGVPEDRATAMRPAYRPGAVWSPELGAGAFVEITDDVILVMSGGVELLADEIKESPIVEQDYVLKGFAAVNYLF